MSIVTNNPPDMGMLKDKRLIIVGEIHGNVADENVVRDLIRVWKPDYVLCEVLGDLELLSREDKYKKLSLPASYFYHEDYTKHWIKIAYEYPIPFIGMEYTKWKPGELERMGLAESFSRREDHWMKVIGKYVSLGKVLVVCGDTHLRTIQTKQLGRISPLYSRYGQDKTALIVRTLRGEIE